MDVIQILLFLLLGLVAGVLSGLVGIGGGTIIIPVLVFLFGFTQHKAQGTTLALMVPPIGILAAWTYYKQGFVDIRAAVLIVLGFFLGGLLGARVAVGIPDAVLRKVFGVYLLVVAAQMFFGKS
ncbi:MAG: sulfite exporter TauE/SafE family protein [Chloroflexi bacterium]|nr:sulfite exporter TauE/SafE family protein [Chloroflexota bacterium]